MRDLEHDMVDFGQRRALALRRPGWPAVRTDGGTRIVAALTGRELDGQSVNRKWVQRMMRQYRLLQPKRSEGRRKRPGYFEVRRACVMWT